MEQFRRIGEVLGSIKALMIFRDNIQINQRQCCLLLDICSYAYDSIAEEMKHNLKFEEQHSKWRMLEQPMREIYKIYKEGEFYIRQSLETRNWFAKAIILYQNSDCIQFHIHNLLTYIPVIIEAIETAGEFSGWDQDETQKRRLIYSKKYEKLWKDPHLFQWKYGKQYLITQDFRERLDTAWKEDRWILLDKIHENKIQCSSKDERQLKDILLKNLVESGSENGKLLPSSILLKSKDYLVRKRLGSGSQYKEIQWLGESLAIRHFFGDIEPLVLEISSLLSLSHPNISGFFCGFTDEEKKECFLVMELMTKDLCSYIKELCGPRNSIPFSVPVAVDLMLQIARGMEYLHSKKIYHGNLCPYNILVKPRYFSTEGYLQVKISGFGLSSVKNIPQKIPNETTLPFIWYAPEVLEETEQKRYGQDFNKYTEKADVYSFGMVCFELLTGKVPFGDSHLQGDKMSRNIRAGERPLFPLNSPKYVTNLTKRCWQTDPNQRPSFSSICRILRYTKRFLAMNPDFNREVDPLTPAVDYCDMEMNLRRKFVYWDDPEVCSISDIPFQMFVYRAVEREKIRASQKETSESGSDKTSISGDENVNTNDDTSQLPPPIERNYPICMSPRPITPKRKPSVSKKSPDQRPSRQPGTARGRSRPPQLAPCGRSLSLNSAYHLANFSPRMKRRGSFGHASDTELDK